MAKVFVDANYFIGLANRAPEVDPEILDEHQCFISILSCHMLFYINKVKVPDSRTSAFISDFNIMDLDQDILNKSLQGPTDDLEDNIQLHCAALCDADFFLTFDKKLLKLKFFGKTEIKASLA